MKTIQFKCPKGIGPPTSVLVDGQPWHNVINAGLVLVSDKSPMLSMVIRGNDVTMTFEGVTVTLRPWEPDPPTPPEGERFYPAADGIRP